MTRKLQIVEVDPQGPDALALLREATIEARALYPELHDSNRPWPTNPETPPGGAYLVAYVNGAPVACGALRPLEDGAVEVRRMFVLRSARRAGLATSILRELEDRADRLGYSVMRLETGNRQGPAMMMYEVYGFRRIVPFGEYIHDPFSVCFEKDVASARRHEG